MSEKPKFTVIDRRKIKADEEQENRETPAATSDAAPAQSEPAAGPHLVVNEPKAEAVPAITQEPEGEGELPAAPTAQESREQKAAYDASSQRLEDLVRAQNPGLGAQPTMTFEHLVQQFFISAMIQMGAGAPDGQQPRVDILGARTTIDLLGVLAGKTKGNLTETEDQTLQTALFDVRMAFLELTKMISMQPPLPPPPGKK
jgi:hypothetical protein